VFRILLSLMLIGTLLVGQTFCCCTAGTSVDLKSAAVDDARCCSCCSKTGTCPNSDSEHREDCPCRQKRLLADVGMPIRVTATAQMHYGWMVFPTAVLSEPALEIVPLLASQNAQINIVRALPRADRVALSQSLLC
jgi:hypothetical protein